MGRIKHVTNRYLWLTYPLLIISAITFFADSTARLAGRLFPVLGPTLRIESMELRQTEAGPLTIIRGTAFKRFNQCSYVFGSLRWYLGDEAGLNVEVAADFSDAPQLRGGGWTSWTGIVVGLFPAQIEVNSFATVDHQCPLWPVPLRSTFYEPGGIKRASALSDVFAPKQKGNPDEIHP